MKIDVVRWVQLKQQQQNREHYENEESLLNKTTSCYSTNKLHKRRSLWLRNATTATAAATPPAAAATQVATTKLASNCDNSLLVQQQQQQSEQQPETELAEEEDYAHLDELISCCSSKHLKFKQSAAVNSKKHKSRRHATRKLQSGTSPTNLLARNTTFLLLCLCLCVGVPCGYGSSDFSDDLMLEESSSGTLLSPDGHFTHTWAVHIPNGDNEQLADRVASDHGFINLGKIFDDHYHFAHHRVSKRSLSPAAEHQLRLEDDHRVNWAKQQKAKSRRKRDFIRMRPSRTSARSLSRVDAVPFDDPKWPQMWYLNRGNGLDMNVIPAWKEGITGKGIVVTILDDGLESDHPDIEHNYDPQASYDVNSHDDDPMPHYDMIDSNRHGTRCAGEVAATANNSKCAVGIAYGARVGGVRMLDGDVTDAVEARSLSLNPQHIDIYSASWGPDDDGKTVDGPGELASRAFLEGVTKGRRGKGSIFIWASGNGGREFDNCNCDGYTNSIWTLSISSATEEGQVPWYSEKCSSTLATTYSSGSQTEKQVVTTDLHHSCTVSHTGTSASAPLAAGIAALVLESNTNLTWRDLQHIVVRTAKPGNLTDPTWRVNGVGRYVSHSFGYGMMDAAEMVKTARNWKTVPEQQRCEINAPHVDKVIPSSSYITLQLTVKHCSAVKFLEHVQAKITLTTQRRGDIQLFLKSPAGTKVTLLTTRVHDVSRSGFNQWPFMSVHTWGESPHGNWQLEIHNGGQYRAKITQWDLIFYGTETPAQPGEPAEPSSGQFGPYGNDMDNNDIDFDNSGQWRNMKQVGDNRIIHDKTNVSCLTTTSDNQCLACAPPTYLYRHHCLDFCPLHTYPTVSEQLLDGVDTNTQPAAGNNKLTKNDEPEDDLQSLDRKRKRELIRPTYSECGECDKSCLRCYGPLNSQCSTCYPGSQLRKLLRSNETYCYAFAERSTSDTQGMTASGSASNASGNKANANAVRFVLIAAPLVVVISVVAFFLISERKCRVPSGINGAGGASGASGNASTVTKHLSKASYNYDRVALLDDGDDMELGRGQSDDDDGGDDTEDEEVDIFTQPFPQRHTFTEYRDDEIVHELRPAINDSLSSDSAESSVVVEVNQAGS